MNNSLNKLIKGIGYTVGDNTCINITLTDDAINQIKALLVLFYCKRRKKMISKRKMKTYFHEIENGLMGQLIGYADKNGVFISTDEYLGMERELNILKNKKDDVATHEKSHMAREDAYLDGLIQIVASDSTDPREYKSIADLAVQSMRGNK